MLKFFLACGRHIFAPLSKATAIQAIARPPAKSRIGWIPKRCVPSVGAGAVDKSPAVAPAKSHVEGGYLSTAAVSAMRPGSIGLRLATLIQGHTTMTDDKIALKDLLKKSSDASLLHEMIGFAAQRLMALETDALCGAGHGDRRTHQQTTNMQRRCMRLVTRGSVSENATVSLPAVTP